MENELFTICDTSTFKTSKGDTLYYVNVYSNLTEECEKVYVSAKDFEFIVQNLKAIDTSKHFTRTYNKFAKKFAIYFKK